MIKQRWEQLSVRDQNVLKIGGIILGVLFALRFVWWPMFSRVDTLREQIEQEHLLVQWMAPRVSEIVAAKQSGKMVKLDKSLPALEKSLQQTGLKPYVKEFSQNAQRQVAVTFADVPFESCMQWLEQVQAQGWAVQQFNSRKGEKSGIVQIEITLS